MRSIFALLILLGSMAPAFAEDCPPKYRFVEFGRVGPDGVIRKGGPIFRAVDFTNMSIIDRAATQCRAVSSLAVDGHAQPVPVVSRVVYDATALAAGLSSLQLEAVEDIAAQAEENAARHRAAFKLEHVKVSKGLDHLCASFHDTKTTSCQVVSPYGDNQTVIVFCEMGQCTLSFFEVGPGINAKATWPHKYGGPMGAGLEATEIAAEIKALLEELS
jgi:hypothetical protein